MKLKFSAKFYWGAAFIIFSLILGQVTKVIFLLALNEGIISWSMVIVYVLTWPMLVIGAWWMGKEYADKLQKYFRYKYYHKYVVEGTKKAAGIAKARTVVARTRAKEKAAKMRVNVNHRKEQFKGKLKRRNNSKLK